MKQRITNLIQIIKCWAWKTRRRLRFKRVAARKVIDALDLYPEIKQKTFVTRHGELITQSAHHRAPIIGVMEWAEGTKLRAGVSRKRTVLDFVVIFNPYQHVEGE